MAWKRERKGVGGFIARWFRRIRRLALLAAAGAAAFAWWQGRSGGSSTGTGPSGGRGGGDGGGRRAPIGGPRSPSALRAVAEPPDAEPELVSAIAGGPQATSTDIDGAVSAAGVAAAVEQAGRDRAWVEPLQGGACPAPHPIKANDNSGIFHVPGGRFYDRTAADRCYRTAEAAEADGYRRAKS